MGYGASVKQDHGLRVFCRSTTLGMTQISRKKSRLAETDERASVPSSKERVSSAVIIRARSRPLRNGSKYYTHQINLDFSGAAFERLLQVQSVSSPALHHQNQ